MPTSLRQNYVLDVTVRTPLQNWNVF